MSNELTIVTPQNIQEVTQGAPAAYEGNKKSHDACIAFGRGLLDRVQTEGMTDELDQEIAKYIEKVKKTVKKMNDARSPITKLFDEFRNVFTTMENEVSVSKSGTIPYLLQAERNKYAEKKAKEEAARRYAEEQKRLAAQASIKYKADLIEDYKSQFNMFVNLALNNLTTLNSSLTLQNWGVVTEQIRSVATTLDPTWINTLLNNVYVSPYLSRDEVASIKNAVIQELNPKFIEQYKWEVEEHRDSIMARFASKKRELETAAQASAEEAARIQEEIRAREAAEAARKEQERMEAEAAEKRQRELAGQMHEMGGLFDAAAANVPSYQPKTSVKKKINPLNTEAFPVIMAFWWDGVGKTMTVEELSKTFKSMLTYCDKQANDKNSPTFIQSEHIEYIDDIKAK